MFLPQHIYSFRPRKMSLRNQTLSHDHNSSNFMPEHSELWGEIQGKDKDIYAKFELNTIFGRVVQVSQA